MIKIGILFNCNDNNFFPYLEWISKNYLENFILCGVLTNNESLFISKFPNLKKCLKNNIEDVLVESDLIFSLGYWRILKKREIEKVPNGVINFHHSYNLSYKGRHTATWVIRNNEIFHGSTMHFIDENVDEGKIVETRKFRIEKNDTAESIFNKANLLGLEILKDNFLNVINNNCNCYHVENSHTHTYRYRDLSHEISLDSLNNTKKLYDEIRSLTFSKKPAPYIILEGKKIFLKLEGYDSGLI